ncbi:MAG TPA: hypothetical protein VKX17_19475 [Planctomycetota bacterium]|nr:hypothetical protein [Planctomycetota bacterium]
MASEQYQQYKKLLLKLHDLTVQERDQTDEADAVRDAMDAPGSKLTALEHQRVSGLSADLYMLLNDEVKEPTDPSSTPNAFAKFWDARNWDAVLSILRKQNVVISDDELAHVRALCWEELGDYDVALLFAEYAAKLKPDNMDYRFTLVRNQLNLGMHVNSKTLEDIVMHIARKHDLPVAESSFLQPA